MTAKRKECRHFANKRLQNGGRIPSIYHPPGWYREGMMSANSHVYKSLGILACKIQYIGTEHLWLFRPVLDLTIFAMYLPN